MLSILGRKLCIGCTFLLCLLGSTGLGASRVARNVTITEVQRNIFDARSKAMDKAKAQGIVQLAQQQSHPLGKVSMDVLLTHARHVNTVTRSVRIQDESFDGTTYRLKADIVYDRNALDGLARELKLPQPAMQTVATTASGRRVPKQGGDKAGTQQAVKVEAKKTSALGHYKQRGDVILIPVYINEDQTYLWQKDNPITLFLNRVDRGAYFLPLGDLEDMQLVSTEKAVAQDQGAMNALMQRYGRQKLLLVIMREFDPKDFYGEIQVLEISRNQKPLSQTYASRAGESRDAFFSRILLSSVEQMNQGERDDGREAARLSALASTTNESASTEAQAGPGNPATATEVTAPNLYKVTFLTLEEWREIKDRLARIDELTYRMESLSRDHAEITVDSTLPPQSWASQLEEVGLHAEQVGREKIIKIAPLAFRK